MPIVNGEKVSAKELKAIKSDDALLKAAELALEAVDFDKLPVQTSISANPKPYKTTGQLTNTITSGGFRYNVNITINRFASKANTKAAAAASASDMKLWNLLRTTKQPIPPALQERMTVYASSLGFALPDDNSAGESEPAEHVETDEQASESEQPE